MITTQMLMLCVPVIIAIFAAWGALWYRLGRLASEVKDHNKMLSKVEKKLDAIAAKEGVEIE